MLVVETLRIETAVLLNEVARMTFDSGGGQVAQAAEAAGKQRGVASYLALLEHVINVVVDQQGTLASRVVDVINYYFEVGHKLFCQTWTEVARWMCSIHHAFYMYPLEVT